jgi:Uncharacterized conserved protein
MKEVLEFLKLCGVYFIATEEGDQPRVRPFGAQCEFEGKLYLTTSNQKAVYAQMKANPKVEISGMAPDGRWIRLTAEAVFDERREARKAMLDANPTLGNLYSLDDGKFEVFYLRNASAVICSFTAAPVTYSF